MVYAARQAPHHMWTLYIKWLWTNVSIKIQDETNRNAEYPCQNRIKHIFSSLLMRTIPSSISLQSITIIYFGFVTVKFTMIQGRALILLGTEQLLMKKKNNNTILEKVNAFCTKWCFCGWSSYGTTKVLGFFTDSNCRTVEQAGILRG